MAKCFVISIKRSGTSLYLKREEMGEVNEKGEIIRESRGWFTPDLIEAKKFLNKTVAEITCASYKGAVVETIKTGEVLK